MAGPFRVLKTSDHPALVKFPFASWDDQSALAKEPELFHRGVASLGPFLPGPLGVGRLAGWAVGPTVRVAMGRETDGTLLEAFSFLCRVDRHEVCRVAYGSIGHDPVVLDGARCSVTAPLVPPTLVRVPTFTTVPVVRGLDLVAKRARSALEFVGAHTLLYHNPPRAHTIKVYTSTKIRLITFGGLLTITTECY